MQDRPPTNTTVSSLWRTRFIYVALSIVFAIFVVRLFHLQVIKHEYYRTEARQGQLKEYEIPASRGVIEAHDGDAIVPIVLNQKKYTLFADPLHVKNAELNAQKIASIIGGDVSDYESKMQTETRYSVLAKKLDKQAKEEIEELDLLGIGLREQEYRTYPQGEMAAQALGFVNDDGEGVYGIEQNLDEQLRGTPGQLRAITDSKGVPLVSNEDNVITAPQKGDRVVLSLDMVIQRYAQDALKSGLKRAQSKSGSVVVLEADSGKVKAMANYPTYDPNEFFNVDKPELFTNPIVSQPFEIGSIMKSFTVAAALDAGVVNANTTYADPGSYKIDDATVTNIVEAGGAGTRSISDILQYSLNTGAVYLLMQMGGGELNDRARQTWHDYMVNRFEFGKSTGVEQGFEAPGVVPDPNEGWGLNIQYANTSFGQGMTATPMQMAAALAGAVNGGTYYKPSLIDKVTLADGTEQIHQPKVVNESVVNDQTSKDLRRFMELTAAENRYVEPRIGYSVGGKTGTAQINKPDGGYYEDRFNGTFLGYVGGETPKYIIMVRADDPKIGGYAGSQAAAPIFKDIVNSLIDNFRVTPKAN